MMKQFAVLLAACLAASACNDSPTGGNDAPLPLGATAVGVTAVNGQTTVTFQGEENDYQIGVTLQDFDTDAPAAGLELHAIALADGIFLRTEDPSGDYFSSTRYIPYSAFQTSLAHSASIAPADPESGSLLAGYALVIAVFAVGSALYEYITDPPGFEEVFNDDGTSETCLTGDLNDVLSAFAAGGINTISGAIRVFGAPAKLRGVTSINLGFTRLRVYQQFNREALTTLVDNYTGLLDTDVTVWCWPRVGNQDLPLIRGEVTRQATQFDIVRVLSLADYPIAPSRSQITTTMGAQWSGTPAFPVAMIVTPVACYPGWVCYDWLRSFTMSTNPMTQQFGCWSSNPSARSGSMTFRVELRDRNGVTTPPATFNFRCGTGTGQALGSLSGTSPDAGGFVGPPEAAER